MTEHLHFRRNPITRFQIPMGLTIMIFSTIFLHASPGFCHGVEGYVQKRHGYQVNAFYDDGEPMSYAAVEIKSPGETVAFQIGRTDRNGVMMFQPDRPGPWQAIVTDGMGHRLALALDVSPAGEAAEGIGTTVAETRPTGSKGWNMVAGLAIIFGLCGLLYGWKGRRHPTTWAPPAGHAKH